MVTNSETKAGSVRNPAPGLDIFKTPENPTFYSANLYQSLDKSKQQIRLIELSTQSGDDGILECKLLPATLLTDARKQYLALSYCAGDPTDTKDILVNGVRCNIFANLHHALVLARHYWIRSSGQGPLRLWVDQLCINQQDLKERSHQVGFMRDIYQGAEHTLACLSTTKASGRGLKWLIDMCEAVPSREDDLLFQYEVEGELDIENSKESERTRKKISNTTIPERFEDNRCQPTRMHEYIRKNMHREKFVNEWIAFYDVISSPWWNRAWICQEFLVSEQVSFMFGHHSVSWERCWKIMQGFCELHRWFLTIQNPLTSFSWFPTDCPGDRRILDIVEERGLTYQVDHVRNALRMKICWSGSMDIKALLSHSRSCKSSDHRDRVYAMLGLAPPGYQIFPDYSRDMSAEEVMIMTTRAIIEKENSLGVLIPATRLLQCRNLDVPSWVVDWTSTEALSVDFGNRRLYGNSSIPHGSPQCTFETITNKNHQTRAHILWVYGTFITKIQWITRKWPYAAFDSAQGRQGCHGRALISIKDGDELWFLYGSRVPMVLRPYLDGYQVISSAFLMRRSPIPTEEDRANRSRIKLY
ncbi:hypothetical protein FACUT_7410 [Fusarium acutatum]|uniref:Heterokaryon incompatibility domain-containing protein n=1 Tax=Fusarium acutatum TaxID=78861 RepID=A0A8H4JP88_9HYPO|nr:hypothetical protein FACUT_7410 [Fusarium acutatum]